MNRTIYALVLIAVASCNQLKPSKGSVENIIEDLVKVKVKDTAETFQTQAEINEAYINDYYSYVDSVEIEFQGLLKALPEYRKEFQKEKAAWEKYMEAVKKVARCADTGSSTPMYVSDVLSQGTLLRLVPIHHLFLHTQGKDLPYSKTLFTQDMITQAYADFINAVWEDEYLEEKKAYENALRKEQKCWEKWLECREKTSKKLSGDVKEAFSIGTNQMMRTKLLQLKNQNQNLGMTTDEILQCSLPDDCSDKALLEYPGFHKVWAKHLEDLDWYPNFE